MARPSEFSNLPGQRLGVLAPTDRATAVGPSVVRMHAANRAGLPISTCDELVHLLLSSMQVYGSIVSAGDIWPAAWRNQGLLVHARTTNLDDASFAMTGWEETRATFRHGDLPDALVGAALVRLEAGGAEALSLRELARDVGVNHRAVYRHFPDKLALLARVAEEGWRRLTRRMQQQAADRKRGEEALIASGVAFFAFAREQPSLFHLMAGPRINMEDRFPALEAAIAEALQVFMQGFLDAGTQPRVARTRTLIFATALQGVITQILHRRFHLSPRKAKSDAAEICRMLIKGLR